MARPRGQRGQIKHHGSNWLFVYYVNGKRTHTVLARSTPSRFAILNRSVRSSLIASTNYFVR